VEGQRWEPRPTSGLSWVPRDRGRPNRGGSGDHMRRGRWDLLRPAGAPREEAGRVRDSLLWSVSLRTAAWDGRRVRLQALIYSLGPICLILNRDGLNIN
jgi:hypothetical protein